MGFNWSLSGLSSLSMVCDNWLELLTLTLMAIGFLLLGELLQNIKGFILDFSTSRSDRRDEEEKEKHLTPMKVHHTCEIPSLFSTNVLAFSSLAVISYHNL